MSVTLRFFGLLAPKVVGNALGEIAREKFPQEAMTPWSIADFHHY